ncbi:MAG: response regulator [Planctomycetaceae bacterium]|jgi:signal transduction histidine kinase/CheY-like chemotaxis protein|nr:response regulator [Planctomycetaceae bacterium]
MNYFFENFFDLIVLTFLLIIILIGLSFYLHGQKQSYLLARVWGIFGIILIFGIFCLVSIVQNVRTNWLSYFEQSAKSYARLAVQFDNDQIEPGNPDLFSEWTDPVIPTKVSTLTDPRPLQESPALTYSEPEKQLDTPKGLKIEIGTRIFPDEPNRIRYHANHWAIVALLHDNTAYDKCVHQAVLQWDPVPDASTYRVQWCRNDLPASTSADQEWLNVYSGSKNYCILDVPDVPLQFRLRAETGTPEDDPVYLALMKLYDDAVFSNVYLGSTYTMQIIDEHWWQFIVAPGCDANHDNRIDENERATPIGELYENTGELKLLQNSDEKFVVGPIVVDEWGTWNSAFAIISQPDDNHRSMVGLDFHANILIDSIRQAKVLPYCFFLLVNLFYFSGILLVAKLKRSWDETRKYAEKLQNTVTMLNEAEQEAKVAVEAKMNFLTNMSHEIRTPMNAVLGFTNILEQKLMPYCPPEQQQECQSIYNSIVQNGNALLAEINKILNFVSTGENAENKPVLTLINIPKLIEELHQWTREHLNNKPIQLNFIPFGEIPKFIVSDQSRLLQILKSLLDNAIKFTDKGSIQVTYGIDFPSIIIASDLELLKGTEKQKVQKKIIYFEITDTGIGIAEKDFVRIFQLFTQTDNSLTRQHGGVGLGLTLAKQFAEMLGGTITVSSTQGQGSTFILSLPIEVTEQKESWNNSAKQEEKTPVTCSAEQPLTGLKILVVEDNKVNQVIMASQLQKAGAEVVLADNGQIGLDKINKTETDKTFDIVLMDMQMPVMDGYQATTMLRRNGYTHPIIAVTAHALDDDRQKVLNAGCNDYLTKPFQTKHLFETILKYVEKK